MTKCFRVGVVGLGNMGKNHVRILSQLGVLEAVYDTNKNTKEQIAFDKNVYAAKSLEDLLCLVDAVFVASPSSSHYEIAYKSLQMGKHVFVEKPLTLAIHEAEKLVNLASHKERVLQVGHIERFNPVVIELKKILSEKMVVAINLSRLSNYDPRINDTDVVFDLMIHDIDLVNYLLNEDFVVKGTVSRRVFSSNFVDYCTMLAESKSGIAISCTSSRVTEEKIRSISVTTKDCYITADLLTKQLLLSRRTNLYSGPDTVLYKQENVIERIFVPNVEPLLAQDRSFLETIERKAEPLVSGYDAIKALRILEDINANNNN